MCGRGPSRRVFQTRRRPVSAKSGNWRQTLTRSAHSPATFMEPGVGQIIVFASQALAATDIITSITPAPQWPRYASHNPINLIVITINMDVDNAPFEEGIPAHVDAEEHP